MGSLGVMAKCSVLLLHSDSLAWLFPLSALNRSVAFSLIDMRAITYNVMICLV